MTKERLEAVLLFYGDLLKKRGHRPERNADPNLKPWEYGDVLSAMRHLTWMADEALRFVEEGSIEKAMRWLGFIQGAFWALGFRKIEEMKDDNRMPGEGA